MAKRTTEYPHWSKYSESEETFGLLLDTVEELEFRLRQQFPDVFLAARVREQLRRDPPVIRTRSIL